MPPPRVRVDEYRERASRIIGAALTSDVAYRRLAWLTDRIGHRLSGFESLTRAIEWAVSEMRRDKLEDVRAEKVMVPHWVRGERPLLHLRMGAKFLPDAESANVIAELRGRERPEEVVVIGGHIDSWDVGQGARDGGGGCVASWEAARLLKSLGLRPRRNARQTLK